MATETLLSPLNNPKRVCLALLIIIFIDNFHCQQFIIPFQSPSECKTNEFFDISSLSCGKCLPNQRRSSTGMSCICRNGYKVVANTEKITVACEACPAGKPAVTNDGYECIGCPHGLTDEGHCLCPPGNILVERDFDGKFLDIARCVTCDGKISAFSVPNKNGDRCERCHITFLNSSCSCTAPNVLAGGLCVPAGSLPSSINPIVNYGQLKFSLQSIWFVENLYASSAACLVFSNVTACQALGNMCVMNMHSFSSQSADACGLFNTIFRSRASLSSVQDISYWRVHLPWLYYGDEPGLASRVLSSDPVPTSFSFKGINKNTDIQLIAAVYNVRGEFLRWEKIGGNNLQICPDGSEIQAAAFTFGTSFQENCDLPVIELLTSYPEPFFYDVFMLLNTKNGSKLLPLPTLVKNQQYNGVFINQETMKNWYLSRRLFVVDTLSGRETSLSSPPKVIRVATSISIRFQLVPHTQVGQIYPPLLTVEYTDVLLMNIESQTVSIKFDIQYEMDQSEAQGMTDIAIGVLGGLAFVLSLLKTVGWKRRMVFSNIDVQTMIRFMLFYADNLGTVLFIVTVGTGLYWLIFYKAQQFVSVLLPLPDQEKQFVMYIIFTFILKVVDFLHKLILQVSIDIFLIDWERPRSKGAKTVPVNGDTKREPAPVSIWRTYFVANEWNELQCVRKISPTFQIMAVLFFLEVLDFSSLTLRDPWTILERPAHKYSPPFSLILRYGLASTLWLSIGLLQSIFFTVFYEHFVEDKIRQFVDLCSVSNISVILFSHRCFGYYIHGRSVHGHADTNMEEMNNNLKRERDSLCGQRGLLPNTDGQIFQVSFTSRLRQQYDRIQESINRNTRPSRLIDATTGNWSDTQFKAYNTMNHFLGLFIDHAHYDLDYIVKDKLALERILEMEFLEPNENTIFYHDDSHSFSNLLYYGNETTLLIFDTLFFCVVDLASQSFVLAAVLTYVQQQIFCYIRNSLGRRNLINKTLVDRRFLI